MMMFFLQKKRNTLLSTTHLQLYVRLRWSRVMISAPIEWSDRKALSQPNLPQGHKFCTDKEEQSRTREQHSLPT